IDMVMHPENPSIIYAAAWNRIRNAMESVVNDDDAKIFKTTDSGANWTILTEGLPGNDLVRIGLSVSPALPDDIWAVYVDNSQSLEGVYHSEDEGETWTAVSAQSSYPANLLGGFGWYFGKVAVNPYNSDDIFVLGVDLARTQNNGASWEYGDDFLVHADKHSLHFVDENTMLLATDGGLYKTEDNGNNWTPISNIPNTQLYRVEVNPHISGEYTAGAQDNGTSRGSVDEIENWERIFGGDGFQARYHPTDPDILYAETQNGSIWVSTDGGNIFDWANDGLNDADRRNWDMPYIVSQHDPDVLYTGTFRVYRSNNGVIPFWEPISEDVTDGIDDRYHTITAIAESPIDANVLYVGTSDANIYRSVDYGATWENVSDGLPEHYVTSVHASPLQSTLVYATVSGYKGNSYIPHVQRSKDSGSSWEDITGDLPQVGVNDILILPEDTTESTFFVATDAGVYATLNGGINWQRVGGDMPFIHVFDIAYDAPNRKLVAGTFSRSVQSFDLTEILDYDMITGIPTDFVQQLELEISPNPTTDFVQIRLPETSNQISNEVEFTLTSIDGRLLKKFTENSTSSAMHLDMSHLPCGLYYLTTIVNSVQYQAKIVRK
ncbi:MAG: T9SS type A sorting domain-containing protein, partial [Chitinophagales bacterium]